MIEEISQINLETKPEKRSDSAQEIKKTKKSSALIKTILGILGSLVILAIILVIAIVLPLKNIYGQGLITYQFAKEAAGAVKNQDLEKAQQEIKKTKEQALVLQKSYQSLSWTGIIPFLGSYWKDGDSLLKASLAGLDAGEISLEAIAPYADLLGLKGKSTFVSKSTDERIQTAVLTLDKLTPKIGEIGQKLEIVNKEIKKIDASRYPESFKNFKPRAQITEMKTTIESMSELFISARPLLEIIPKLLGEPNPIRYLVIFQNDKELRPTGGFITAYGIFRLEKGKMKLEASEDIYKLSQGSSSKLLPPKPFMDHLKVYSLYLRDSNFEPDFLTSMKQFEDLYFSVPGRSKYDGIVSVDTHVLVEVMKILGAIPAYGTNFTAEPDKRCNGCPNIIYELEEYAGKRVGYIREDRKDIIGVVLYQIMQKALGISPSQYWGKLFQMALSEIQQKHILVYMIDEKSQKAVEALNMGGRMREFEGDYLHVNDANLGGAKSNMFVEEAVKVDYTFENGQVVKTVTINYKNPQPGSPGCNLELGGLCLNGPMPNWLRVYVPKGSELIEFKGSEDEAGTSEAFNKTVFSGFLTVKPLGTAQIVLKYRLPIKTKEFNGLIQKQPGTVANEYIITVNGKQVDKFNLETDKEIKIKL